MDVKTMSDAALAAHLALGIAGLVTTVMFWSWVWGVVVDLVTGEDDE